MNGLVLEIDGVSDLGMLSALGEALMELGMGGRCQEDDGLEDEGRFENLPVLRMQAQGMIMEAQKLRSATFGVDRPSAHFETPLVNGVSK